MNSTWNKYKTGDGRLLTPGQNFTPLIFCLKTGPSRVVAGRYFYHGAVVDANARKPFFMSIQGMAYTAKEVSHWMPIPDPPKEEQ